MNDEKLIIPFAKSKIEIVINDLYSKLDEVERKRTDAMKIGESLYQLGCQDGLQYALLQLLKTMVKLENS